MFLILAERIELLFEVGARRRRHLVVQLVLQSIFVRKNALRTQVEQRVKKSGVSRQRLGQPLAPLSKVDKMRQRVPVFV